MPTDPIEVETPLTDEGIDLLLDRTPAEHELEMLIDLIYSDLHNFDEALYWGDLDAD